MDYCEYKANTMKTKSVKSGAHRLFNYSDPDQTNAVLTPNVGQ